MSEGAFGVPGTLRQEKQNKLSPRHFPDYKTLFVANKLNPAPDLFMKGVRGIISVFQLR